jgi:3',5'-cyclic-AMP phosphodiesterase
MVLVAQITDTHLFADDRQRLFDCPTNQTFARVIQAIAQLESKPELILLTGDISQDETPESYEYAKSLIEPLQIPSYWLPGNHDQNRAAIAALNGDWISPVKAFEQSGWQFILLDSMVIQQPYGELSEAQLNYLEERLRMSLPTLVAIHHHLLPCGLDYMDAINLRNADVVLEIFDRHPQVKVVLSGHIHQEFSAQRGDALYLGTPSTCIQLKANGTKVMVDAAGSPGFRLLDLKLDGWIATAVHWVVS